MNSPIDDSLSFSVVVSGDVNTPTEVIELSTSQ